MDEEEEEEEAWRCVQVPCVRSGERLSSHWASTGAKQHDDVQPPKSRNWVPLVKAPVMADIVGSGACSLLLSLVRLTWDQDEAQETRGRRRERGRRERGRRRRIAGLLV